MSYGANAYFEVGEPRRSSRQTSASSFFGRVAVGGLVLGCAWTVYANVFGANVFPSAPHYDDPVVRRPQLTEAQPARPTPQSIVNSVFASLPASPPALKPAPAREVASSFSFNDRFAAAAPQAVESRAASVDTLKPQDVAPPVRLAALPQPAAAPIVTARSIPVPARRPNIAPTTQLASATPAAPLPPSASQSLAQRAKAAVMSIAGLDKPSMVEKLWGKPSSDGSLLAYASADASATGSISPSQNLALAGTQPRYDRSTAVYDISARMVYLPDGTKLEAHSGLGDKLDDPRSASIRMRGVTPPHLYDLSPREALFHGVPALRLKPVGGEEAIYGRSGLLAHTFMLGPNGDSNGCVSFRDYYAFLDAYKNKGIRRLAVVNRID